MKKLFSIILFLFLLPVSVYAINDPGCCTAQGGINSCQFSTGRVVCNDGTLSTTCGCTAPTPSTSPSTVSSGLPYPEPSRTGRIGSGLTATSTPIATLTPIPPVTPACPEFSTYDATNNTCQCQSGYVVNNNLCVSDAEYCWTKYGGNAVYNADQQGCSCASGYAWNNSNTSCISYDEICHDALGSNSYYNEQDNVCQCYAGYGIASGKCTAIPTQPAATPTIIVPVPTTEDLVPIPSAGSGPGADTPLSTPTLDPTIAAKYPEVRTATYYPLKVRFITNSPIPTKKTGGVLSVFRTIWNFFIHLFK